MYKPAYRSACTAVLIGLALAAFAHPAKAAGLDDRFIGNWSGTADITDYADGTPKSMDREMVIDIRKAGKQGFEVYNSLVTTTSETEMKVTQGRTDAHAVHTIFEPTGVPGHWAAQKVCSDPTKSVGCAWARTEGDSLIIDLFAIDKDGIGHLSSNRRTLSADGMKVAFRRIANGELTRSVKGTLKKAS